MQQEITDYIFLDDIDQTGDLAFVFGTWSSWKVCTAKVVDLYTKKLIPKILFTGGVNKGIAEAEIMRKEAVNLGVSDKDIFIENKSTNTLENVLFSLDIIDQKIGFENIKIITVVVKNYHARRALMTLRKHIPAHIKLKTASYDSDYFSFTKDNWFETELGNKTVIGEIEKIKEYLTKGDIEELFEV